MKEEEAKSGDAEITPSGHVPTHRANFERPSSDLRFSPSHPGLLTERKDALELLDHTGHDPTELAANLQDIRIVNRFAGGTAVVLRHLPDLISRVPPGRPVEILDLATGSGDIPRALATWAARNDYPVRFTVTDISLEILTQARRTLVNVPDVTFTVCDAREVALPERSFDIVLCSLSLHHFAPEEAVQVLREMERLSRVGFILNDIRRSAPGYIAAWAASRIATRNRLTRHDMPLSVLRAYTPAELRNLLLEAEIPEVKVTMHPLFRMAAIRAKTCA